jgi:hypothetical protein
MIFHGQLAVKATRRPRQSPRSGQALRLPHEKVRLSNSTPAFLHTPVHAETAAGTHLQKGS